jgi:RecB family endonuclease NucS
MRLVVARCELVYAGRLTARLPKAVRLLTFKADGSFLIHDDAGGFRLLNWDSDGVPPAMNKAEARTLALARVNELRELTWEDLRSRYLRS